MLQLFCIIIRYYRERGKSYGKKKTGSIDSSGSNVNDGGVTTECYGKKQSCTK